MTSHLEVTDLMAENARLRDLVASREDLCGKLTVEANRLRSALKQFVAACDTAPPTSLMVEIGMACTVARTALGVENV